MKPNPLDSLKNLTLPVFIKWLINNGTKIGISEIET
jgi:hypothetical protein